MYEHMRQEVAMALNALDPTHLPGILQLADNIELHPQT
jgi:hypothetical protein